MNALLRLWVTIFLPLLFLSSPIAMALPSLQKMDVFDPPVLYPHVRTVWYSGQRHNVTWEVSNPPLYIINPIGMILLRYQDTTTTLILADNFDILLGRIEITVPYVLTSDQYSLLLYGDSGNYSPKFKIVGKTFPQ